MPSMNPDGYEDAASEEVSEFSVTLPFPVLSQPCKVCLLDGYTSILTSVYACK